MYTVIVITALRILRFPNNSELINAKTTVTAAALT